MCIRDRFTTIPDTKVVIIAGNHDRIQKSSAVLSFQWAPNVTYLMDEEFTSVYFEEINTEVWGFSYHTAEIREPKLNQVQAPGKDRIHILLGHGGDAGHVPIDRAALAVAGFSYVALGPVSYTHLDVYKRQFPARSQLRIYPKAQSETKTPDFQPHYNMFPANTPKPPPWPSPPSKNPKQV